MTNLVNFLEFKKSLLAFCIVASATAISVGLTAERTRKKTREIEAINAREYRFDACVQYALVVSQNGWYPCYQSAIGSIYMYVGEVWKYGKTCQTQQGRYPGGFPANNLIFQAQFYGTEKECLLAEKEKIYGYAVLPENLKREIKLLRPPGNKIDR